MGGRVDAYRAELRDLKRWEPYLKKHSGLPGPRANLELVQAVGDEADSDRLWRFSASADEFLALCGTAGLGKVALMEPDTVMTWLRELASDRRWRVREGVAIGSGPIAATLTEIGQDRHQRRDRSSPRAVKRSQASYPAKRHAAQQTFTTVDYHITLIPDPASCGNA